MVDMYGYLYYTLKKMREWTYGEDNIIYNDFAYESAFVVDEYSSLDASYYVKQSQISIPFDATVHLKGASMVQ